MKKWNLISGIISIFISVLMAIESNHVYNLSKVIEKIDVSDVYLGYAASAFLFVAGIITILYYNKKEKKKELAIAVACGMSSALCFIGPAKYEDYVLYGVWGLACAIVALVFFARLNTDNAENN